MECRFELDDLKRIIYWTTCKFKIDEFHLTSISGKRDLIGGFLDRWVNRASEFVVFKNLLKEKKYKTVTDFFFYGQETKKNAPDVIGLQDNEGNPLVKFAEYNDGTWIAIAGTPWVEVKTCRKDQYLIAVRESQMEDDHFYVIVESNVRNDYLTTILDKSVFNDDIRDFFKMNNVYIRSDANGSIIKPEKITPATDLGFYKLIGIFKGEEVKKYCRLCAGNTETSKAEQPRYIRKIEEANEMVNPISEQLSEGFFLYSFGDGVYLPIYIKFLSEDSEAEVIRKRKTYFCLSVHGRVAVNEHELDHGFHRINFSTFTRNAKYSEWVGYKSLFEKYAKSSEASLLEIFDQLVDKSRK